MFRYTITVYHASVLNVCTILFKFTHYTKHQFDLISSCPSCSHSYPDPGLVSFIRSRQQQLKDHHKVTDPSSSTNQSPQTQSTAELPSVVGKVPGSGLTEPSHSEGIVNPLPFKEATPTSWLHMDVVEKEKMEWMTDVHVHGGNGAAPTRYKSNEVRFSLDGLVIPRNVVLPAHLGLHHHGDEPRVC